MNPETTVNFMVLTKPSQRNVRTSGVVKMLHLAAGQLAAVGEPGDGQIDDSRDGQQRHHRRDLNPPSGSRSRLVEQHPGGRAHPVTTRPGANAHLETHRSTVTRRSIQPPTPPDNSAITT